MHITEISANHTDIPELFKILIKELCRSGQILWQFVRQYLVLRYRRTVLGYFWTLLNPILMMSVTALVFANLFGMPLKEYAVFLFAGMIPWTCFSSIVVQCSASLINNEGLIRKIYLPRIIFPLSISLGVLVDSMLSFIALFAIIMVIGGELSFAICVIPLAFVLLFLFAFGLGMITSIVTVFFRDVQHVLNILMQAWFFLTPIMYKSEALRGKVEFLVAINPMVPFIDLFRAPLYLGALPDAHTVASCVLLVISSLAAGLTVFLWKEKKVVYRL